MGSRIFCKATICLLIWGLLCVNCGFAAADSESLKIEYLSPRLNLSMGSLQQAIEQFSIDCVDEALRKTAQNINYIGKRNFKRDLRPRELVVALAMIFEGKTLRHIDNHFMVVVDIAENKWDWNKDGEPPADNPAYYLRYCKTFSRMGGEMHYLTADNRDFLLALYQELMKKSKIIFI